MKSDKWTDRLPDLMEGYTEAEPEGLWDAVQAGLKPRRRVAAGWWYAGGGLLAAACVALAVFLWPAAPVAPVTDPVPEAVVPGLVARVEEKGEDVTPSEDSVARAFGLAQNDRKPAAPQNDKGRVAPQNDKESVQNDKSDEVAPSKDSVARAFGLAQNDRKPVAPQNDRKPAAPQNDKEKVQNDKAFKAERKKTRQMQVALSSGSLLAQADPVMTQGFGIPEQPGMATTKGSFSVPMLSRNRASTTEARHRQSARLALELSYGWTPRWSVGTGVTYTTLQSTYFTLSGNTRAYTDRRLNYLGVPLTLRYQLVDWKRLSLYVNAGPLFETSVGGQSTVSQYAGDNLLNQTEEPLQYRDFRVSATAGAGLQLRIFRHGALFVQPGLSWHLTGNDSVESLYTVQPLSFELSLGYRILL